MRLKLSLLKRAAWLGGGLLLLNILACRSLSALPTPTSTSVPVVGVDELQFSDPQTAERFRTLDACIGNLVDESWQRRPYELIGNFTKRPGAAAAGARLPGHQRLAILLTSTSSACTRCSTRRATRRSLAWA
jgi:hypothetical protein